MSGKVTSGSIFEALRKVESVEDPMKKVCPDCGHDDTGDEDGKCKVCGVPMVEEEDDDIDGVEVVFDDIDGVDDILGEEDDDPEVVEEDDDIDLTDPDVIDKFENVCGHTVCRGDKFCAKCGAKVEEDDDIGDELVVDKYNEDTIRFMESLLKKAKAPAPVMKAFERKLYERCSSWLEKTKGVKLDLREGFSKKESARIKKHLESRKAPKFVMEAFSHGQYSIVSAYLKARK